MRFQSGGRLYIVGRRGAIRVRPCPPRSGLLVAERDRAEPQAPFAELRPVERDRGTAPNHPLVAIDRQRSRAAFEIEAIAPVNGVAAAAAERSPAQILAPPLIEPPLIEIVGDPADAPDPCLAAAMRPSMSMTNSRRTLPKRSSTIPRRLRGLPTLSPGWCARRSSRETGSEATIRWEYCV